MLQTGKWCWSRISLAHVVRESICTRTLDDEVCGVAMGYGVPLEPIHSPKPSPDFRETLAKKKLCFGGFYGIHNIGWTT